MNALIKKVRYYKEKEGFGIYEVSNSDKLDFVAVHLGMPLLVGQRYRFVGHWDFYQGEKQYVISEVFPPDPDSLSSLLEILIDPEKFAFPKDLATRIVKQFGMGTLPMIRQDPKVLLEVSGVSKYRVAFLEEQFCKKNPTKEMESYLLSSNVSTDLVKQIIQTVDPQVFPLIRQNPYLLCRFDSSFFRVSEQLGKASLLTDHCTERVEGALFSILLKNEKRGNLRISLDEAKKQVEERLKTSIFSIDESLSNHSMITMEKDFLYLTSSYEQMKRVAHHCKKLLANFTSSFTRKEVETVIEEVETELGFLLSKEQKEAIIQSEQSGISIVLGKPGSGKTTLIKAILFVFKKLHGDHPKILLGAPTGIAAWRMSNCLEGIHAFTLHKLLGLFPGEETSKISMFDASVFMIDELSMVDLSLFSMFIEKIPQGGQLILLGDSNQLSSIGPGDVLKDLLDSPIPSTELTTIYRQSSSNSSIIHNASLLLENKTAFSFGNDFAFLPADSFSKAADIIARLFLAQSKRYGLDEVKILCPYRDQVDLLNSLIADRVNPSQQGKKEVRIGHTIFRENDLLLESKNRTLSQGEKIRIHNGDIGKLLTINYTSENTELHILFPGDRQVIYSLEEARTLTHAYALTIHKSQGSEFDCVMMCMLDSWNLPSEGRMISKSLLYTAMTRAKKQFYWIGSMEILPKIYEKNEKKRNTGLSGFLRKEIKQ